MQDDGPEVWSCRCTILPPPALAMLRCVHSSRQTLSRKSTIKSRFSFCSNHQDQGPLLGSEISTPPIYTAPNASNPRYCQSSKHRITIDQQVAFWGRDERLQFYHKTLGSLIAHCCWDLHCGSPEFHSLCNCSDLPFFFPHSTTWGCLSPVPIFYWASSQTYHFNLTSLLGHRN